MAKIPKIPGGLPEVTEWSPEPPQQPTLRPNEPGFHGDGRYGAPANPLPGETLTPRAEPPGIGRRIADTLRGSGQTLRGGGASVGEKLTSAGAATRAAVPSVLKGVAKGAGVLAAPAMEVAPHAAFYTDSNVPLTDKLRVGATDALSTIGGVAGGAAGALFGSGVAPGVGTVAGLVGGGAAGAGAGHAAGKFLTSSDEALRRNGYDPERGVTDLFDGKGTGATLRLPDAPVTNPAGKTPTVSPWAGRTYQIGEQNGTGGAGRGSVNPAVVNPGAPAPVGTKVVNPDGTITRDGNSFSGKDIQFGAETRNPNGTLRAGGKGFGVTSLDTSEGHRQNLLELQRNAAERAAAPAPAGAMGFGGRTVVDDVVAKGKSGGPDLSRLPPVRRAQMEASLRQSQDANANALNIAGLHDSTARAGMGSAQAIAAMHDATQRRSNDQNNATSLRGQDITYAGHMAPLQLAAMQRGMHAQAYGAIGAGANGAPITADQHLAAAKLLHSQGLPEQAAKAEAAAASMTALGGAQDAQSVARAKGTADLFKPFFTAKDKDGNDKFDEVGAAKAAATVRGIYGEKFDRLSDDQKRAAMTEIVAKQRNMDAERQVMPGFVDRAKDLVGMYEKPPEATAPRDLRGGKIENAGLFSPPGVSRHSKLLRLPNGQTINYGEANDEQLREIGERAQLRPTR